INGCKAFESAGLSPADSDSAQNDSISGCRSGSRNETAAMRNFGSPYGRYWMVRPSSSLAASEAGQGAPKSRSTPCHTTSTAQSPRSASKSARTFDVAGQDKRDEMHSEASSSSQPSIITRDQGRRGRPRVPSVTAIRKVCSIPEGDDKSGVVQCKISAEP